MAFTPITVDEILETLSPEEKDEVLREEYKIPLQLYLTGYNRYPVFERHEVVQAMRDFARTKTAVKSTIARNPDILKMEIKDPVFVIGLARSGTTMLHRLLNSDPQFVAPMLWELIEPVPPGRPQNYKECERYKKSFDDIGFKDLVKGDINHRHFITMESAEECFAALRPYFMNFMDLVSVADMPELRTFIYNFPEGHAVNMYQYYKNCLQSIFYRSLSEGSKLLLKCPIHCLYLDAIREVFPSAKFIFPYRNSTEMLGSFCSLVHELIWLPSDESADPVKCGQQMLHVYKEKSKRAVRFMKTAPKDVFIAVPYTEMVSNPLDALRKVYSHFNWNMTPETIAMLQSHVKANKQNKHGKAEYNMADYGVTEADIKEHMKEYLEYFADGPEKV